MLKAGCFSHKAFLAIKLILFSVGVKTAFDLLLAVGCFRHSTKPDIRFCSGSNPAGGVSEIRDGEDL